MKLKILAFIILVAILVPLIINVKSFTVQNRKAEIAKADSQTAVVQETTPTPALTPKASQSSVPQQPVPQEEISKPETKQSKIAQIKDEALLDVPIVSQKPELYNGCEVTSLTMLLQYAGIKADKMTLAKKITKDTTSLVRDKSDNIIEWGDPNDGFVGDITGKSNIGYGVYPKPILDLLEKYLPGRSVNLSGQSFDTILKSVDDGKPVVVWVTVDFNLPSEFVTWQKNGKTVKATFDEHAVLLVGYDKSYCYVNNPLNGIKNEKVSKDTFIKVWDSMGDMAVSYN